MIYIERLVSLNFHVYWTRKCTIIVSTAGCLLISGVIIAAISALLGVLPLDAPGTATTEGRLQTEVNVLLRVQTDDE